MAVKANLQKVYEMGTVLMQNSIDNFMILHFHDTEGTDAYLSDQCNS